MVKEVEFSEGVILRRIFGGSFATNDEFSEGGIFATRRTVRSGRKIARIVCSSVVGVHQRAAQGERTHARRAKIQIRSANARDSNPRLDLNDLRNYG